MGPFIMNPRAWRASSPARAWPRVRSPSTTSRSRRRWATTRCIPAKGVTSNPAARVFKDDLAAMGTVDKFPFVATTYRLTEHFHY